MFRPKIPGKKIIFLAAIVLCTFLGADVQKVKATESGCVTCHLDQEMLKKTVKVEKGKKSAMQSGAG
jgi:hypothetical protein